MSSEQREDAFKDTEQDQAISMNADTSSLLRGLVKLPSEIRAALAGSLLDSLDEAVDTDLEAAWETEIVTRLSELDNSELKTMRWFEARRIIAGE